MTRAANGGTAISHRILVMWTVPRSVSTSFERMTSARRAHVVFDEPLSRSYYYGPDRRKAIGGSGSVAAGAD